MHEKVLTRADPPLTFLERFDPRIKVVCALAWIVAVVTTPAQHGDILAVHAIVLLGLLALNNRILGKFIRRLAAALPFIVLLAILLPFFKEGRTLWQWGPVEITREGLAAAERVAATALLCVATVSLVWATTTEPDLIEGLKGVGLPALLVGVIMFMLRYLHVLRPELHHLWDARAARTIGRRDGQRIRSSANLLGAFFIRAHDRAERVADAMAARGYDGEWRTARRRPWRMADALLGGVFVAAVILGRWMS
jgi:cobalt/nickel transport system permease protein